MRYGGRPTRASGNMAAWAESVGLKEQRAECDTMRMHGRHAADTACSLPPTLYLGNGRSGHHGVHTASAAQWMRSAHTPLAAGRSLPVHKLRTA